MIQIKELSKLTKIIAIVGPTAVGKTALSIKLAQHFDGEIISGDSMQVYRHLDIGTAKIRPDEMQGIPHHMINIRDITERFSAAEFQKIATTQIKEIASRGKLPIIVGGTGFYLQALIENLSLGDDQFDERSMEIRAQWQQFAKIHEPQEVWQRLKELDPKAAQQIAPNNVRRLIRALEVIEKTGHPFSEQRNTPSEFETLLIGLTTDRPLLYDRINARVDLMMANGLEDEARWLFEHQGRELQAGKGIGYHELFDYFESQCSLDSAVEKIKLDSRHYAKRQLTWFRNKMDVIWFDLVTGQHSVSEIKKKVANWL